jgi:hypothetical protein
MGQLDLTCRAPPRRGGYAMPGLAATLLYAGARTVAVHAAFAKKQRLETRFSLHRLKGWVTRRFQGVGQQLDSTCAAPPSSTARAEKSQQ